MSKELVSHLNRSKVGTIPLSVYHDKKTNCINETINVLEGNEDEIEWNMGEYGEGQSNYNQNPEAINEKINEFDYK